MCFRINGGSLDSSALVQVVHTVKRLRATAFFIQVFLPDYFLIYPNKNRALTIFFFQVTEEEEEKERVAKHLT